MSSDNHKRVLIKLTGLAFKNKTQAIDFSAIEIAARQIKSLVKAGWQVAVVPGGGNVFKGKWMPEKIQSDRGHHMGLLSTVINAVALAESLESIGQPAVMQSFWAVENYIPTYDKTAAIEALESGKVLVMGGGTGRPGVSTDTGSAELAEKTGASEVWKASDIKGVYSADPKTDDSAELISEVTLDEALDRNLGFADKEALEFSKENKISWRVFDFFAGDLEKQTQDNPPGSRVIAQ